VITDLIDDWRLVWLDGSTICEHPFQTRAEAVGFIEDILVGRLQANEEDEPEVARIVKRHKIDDRLAATPGAIEDTLLGEQMQSLEGLLPHSELMQMKAERLMRLLQRSHNPFSARPIPTGMYSEQAAGVNIITY